MVMRSLQVFIQSEGPIAILLLAGEISAFSHGDLEEAFHQAYHPGINALVLDFGKVEYINSAGVAGLIRLITEVGRHGLELCVCGLTHHYRGLFELMHLTDYMCTSENLNSAISDCLTLVEPTSTNPPASSQPNAP